MDQIAALRAARRKTMTLPESGLEFTIRKLVGLDYADARAQLADEDEGEGRSEDGSRAEFYFALVELACVTPTLVVRGRPADTPAGAVHVRDLSDADFDAITAAVADFSIEAPQKTDDAPETPE